MEWQAFILRRKRKWRRVGFELTAISLSPTVREPSLAAGLPWTMAAT